MKDHVDRMGERVNDISESTMEQSVAIPVPRINEDIAVVIQPQERT